MSNEKDLFQLETITKQLAHIVNDENLFVDRIRKIDENIYESEFIIAGDHPYLYENSAISNHVSGTSLLDVTRQLCKAMSHIYYDVPINCRFVMQNTQMDFFGWTKCSVPIYILLDVSVERRLLGGFMSPVAQFINGKYPELTQTDISLISLGVIMTYFFNNIEKLRPVLDLIQKKGLVNEFDSALNKAGQLKDAFLEFMRSLGVLTSSVSNMLAYSFLIPLLPTLLSISQSGVTEMKLQLLVKSILGYVTLITSSTALEKIVGKMVDRFKD